MVYTLTARVYSMIINHDVQLEDACGWVLRNMPKGLKEYYTNQIFNQLLLATI